MRRKNLLWRLYFSYGLILLACLALVGGYAGWELARHTRNRLRADLEGCARLAAAAYLPVRGETASGIRALGRAAHMRITFIAGDGRVVADSEEDASRMGNHGDRPEVKTALGGEVGFAERYSQTVKRDMLYVAVPAQGPDGDLYVARMAIPTEDVQARLRTVYVILGLGGATAAILALGLGYLVARRIMRPLREMERQARRAAGGDLKVEFTSKSPDEIGQLADAMNSLVRQLDEQIRSLVQQKNEREAILSSMVEGVIAVDADERLLMANQAAREMLNLPAEGGVGRPILEAVRNIKLQKLLREVLSADAAREAEVELSPQKRVIKVTGAPLRGEAGREIGCMAVLNDITRMRALERVRSDFVANVSHELKTPITTVKGYIETLREGAVRDAEEVRNFLDIIARHADRLNAIVDDLLSLSRVESDAHSIVMGPLDLRHVVARSLDSVRGKAAVKKIRIVPPEMPEAMPVLGNANLLEQALGNILDNAVKFSPDNTTVTVLLSKKDGWGVLAVGDEGIGIQERDLPRIFERFYRVDKARSRELGGTGLGLAIVKHIVRAHGGEVAAKSVAGKGSVFTMRVPLQTTA